MKIIGINNGNKLNQPILITKRSYHHATPEFSSTVSIVKSIHSLLFKTMKITLCKTSQNLLKLIKFFEPPKFIWDLEIKNMHWYHCAASEM